MILTACDKASTNGTAVSTTSGFTLTSPTVVEGGRLPAEYTCDGTASTLALSWSGAPAATQSFAVIMHTVASPTDIHWYLVLYNIPARFTSLPKNFSGIGTLGINSLNDTINRTRRLAPKVLATRCTPIPFMPFPHAPNCPCQQHVSRPVLLDAIQNITLASAELHVVYARP